MRYLIALCFPIAVFGQHAPVADALRANLKKVAKRLILSAEEMPAAKYAYKPTQAQMTFGEIVVHLAEGNDDLCSEVAGTPAPTRPTMAATDTKAHLVARLEETFAFCDHALASLDDSKFGETIGSGADAELLAVAMVNAIGHYADHYSQAAIYLRLNGLLPPTAKDPSL